MSNANDLPATDTPEGEKTPPASSVDAGNPAGEIPPAPFPDEPETAQPGVDLFPETSPIPPDVAAAVTTPPATPPTTSEPEKKRGRGRPKIHGKYSKDGQPPQQGQDSQPPQPDFSDIVGNLGNQTPAAAAMPTTAVNYKKVAEQFFDLGAGLLAGFVGPEWQPRDKDERNAVVVPLAEYLKTKEMVDLPPNIALLLAIAVYAGPRFGQPATQSKVRALLGKLKSGWQWCKIKIIGPLWLKLFRR